LRAEGGEAGCADGEIAADVQQAGDFRPGEEKPVPDQQEPAASVLRAGEA